MEEVIQQIKAEVDRLESIYDKNEFDEAERILQEDEGFESEDEFDGYINGLNHAIDIIRANAKR